MRLFAFVTVALLAVVDARADGLRLMTYNLNFGNPTPETSLDAIAKVDADIVLLQEITSAWRDALKQRFATQYPHQVHRVDRRAAGGIAVLSKHPLTREELWAPPPGTGAWFPAQLVVVASPLGPLQILNVHLRPALSGGSWIKGFLETPPLRKKEIEAHWKRVDRALPTIVAGDFNEAPTGLAIDHLAKAGLARAPTTGPTTWHYESILRMDIDHVLVDGRLVASAGHVVDAGTSDHRPVVVTLRRNR